MTFDFKKLYIFLNILFISICASNSAQAQTSDSQKDFLATLSEIRICVDPDFMPFEYINNNGEYIGILADYIALFSEHLQTPFVLYPTTSYPESLQALKQGSCHLIVADIATNKIKEDFLTTHVYFVSTRAFAVHKESPFVDDFSKISHQPTGVVVNTPVESLLPQLYPRANIVSVATVGEGLRKVSSGELYSLVNVIGVMTYSLQKQSITNVKIGGILQGGTPFSMLVNREFEPLVAIINNVIPLISEQDRKRIFENWIAVEHVKGIDWLFLGSIIGGVLLISSTIIVIIIVWNKTLRHEISLRKAAEEKLRHLAMVDSLTNVANRNKFYEKLDEAFIYAKRQKTSVALTAIDLDDFKCINDQFGHPVGDAVLIEAARRLEDSCREIDTVARLGGDEFSIIVVDPDIETGFIKLGERILENFAQPIIFEGRELTIGISIGFAIHNEHTQSMETLVANADKALYEAKGKGKNNYYIYKPSTTSNERVV